VPTWRPLRLDCPSSAVLSLIGRVTDGFQGMPRGPAGGARRYRIVAGAVHVCEAHSHSRVGPRFFGASVVRGPATPLGRSLLRASKQDGSVIDRPTTEKGKKVDKSKKFGPIYKVMLHNDNFNRREYVVQVLLKVIDSMQVDDAVNVMQEAHESGIALVTAVVQEDAERYCQGLRNGGLISTIEPDTAPGGSN